MVDSKTRALAVAQVPHPASTAITVEPIVIDNCGEGGLASQCPEWHLWATGGGSSVSPKIEDGVKLQPRRKSIKIARSGEKKAPNKE